MERLTMKKILVSLLMTSQLLVPAAFSASTQLGTVNAADAIFESGFELNQIELLSAEEMVETHGAFIPGYFGYIAAVVTIDLALAGFYWGVYVPTVYTGSLSAYQSYDR
jgi:hypothetical protein